MGKARATLGIEMLRKKPAQPPRYEVPIFAILRLEPTNRPAIGNRTQRVNKGKCLAAKPCPA
jgi:hypothetical protein